MSDEKPQLSKQLREFQSKIKPIKKEGKNPHFKSTYAQHEDVFEYFLPILGECGLSLHQSGKEHNDQFYLETVLENDFGETRTSLWPVCKSDLDVQKKCAAVTYISRHAAMRMLGLSATNDDTDGSDVTLNTPTTQIIPRNPIVPMGTTHLLTEKGLEPIGPKVEIKPKPKNYAPSTETNTPANPLQPIKPTAMELLQKLNQIAGEKKLTEHQLLQAIKRVTGQDLIDTDLDAEQLNKVLLYVNAIKVKK